jgi:hypothetical protein
MSWPVRASLARAESVSSAIDGFIDPGDPPYLGGIAASCRKLRAVEARGRLLRITPPAHLGVKHRNVAVSYAKLRAGCKTARLTALAVRAALDRFFMTGAAADTTLRSFRLAVRTWRASVVQYAATLGIPPPVWVKELPEGR